MTNIRIADISDQPSVVLPPAIAEKLKVRPGDELRVVETTNGFELLSNATAAESQFELAKEIIEEDAETLRKLAE